MRKLGIMLFFCTVALLLHCCTAALSEAWKLPDTGQTTCYSATGGVIPCSGTGQDGEFSINPMSFTNNGNGTVTDNNTGLMWQQNAGNSYNWYQAAGVYHVTYNPNSVNVCGDLALAGYTDWGLPTKKELMSIVDYSVADPGPKINTTYFPNTQSLGYWASPVSARYANYAWWVNFASGHVDYVHFDTGFSYGVRCVRGAETAFGDFVDNGNGTVTDNITGLMWQQQDAGLQDWTSALSYCNGLNLGGRSDWRLSNVKELESITAYATYNPAINTVFFPQLHSSMYWSSTTDLTSSPNIAWGVDYYDGAIRYAGKGTTLYVQCVQGGQPSSKYPNLTPYKPASWSDKIVVSKTTGTNTDSGTLYTTDTLYVDAAMANLGNAATSGTFYNYLYVDGVLKRNGTRTTPLPANTYASFADFSIGSLSAGTHKIKLVIDPTGVITESNETDNAYTKTITVILR
jgi:hypothetical protein